MQGFLSILILVIKNEYQRDGIHAIINPRGFTKKVYIPEGDGLHETTQNDIV